MNFRKLLTAFALSAASAYVFAVTPGPGAQYASDAYPGFDSDAKVLSPERKTPSWFWWRKAKFKAPGEQLAYARGLAAEESFSSAVRAYDALVAEWPISSEAVAAQEELADILLYKSDDPIVAFEEYRYLLNFYSSDCDYAKVVLKMYESAKKMRQNGKRIMFFKFANTADVRRAFETVVIQAPGATFAPEAMYAVVELRVEEEEYSEAIEVCKTVRNRYSRTPQAKAALYKEAELRMILLKAHEYNRDRGLNTVSFMSMAAAAAEDAEERADFLKWRAEAAEVVEKEAYEAAVFYDSVTRKRRGAIKAYEGFLREYPASVRAQKVRERLAELQSTSSVKESK
jgi:TolA-binding protein